MKGLFKGASKIVLSAVMLLTFMNVGPVPSTYAAPCQPETSILNMPTWYKYLEGEDVEGKCKPNIDVAEDALPIGLAVLEIGLTLAGLVAVVMVIIGSFKYVLTLGEPDKATAARKTIINALIGLAITLIATRVVSFIASRVG